MASRWSQPLSCWASMAGLGLLVWLPSPAQAHPLVRGPRGRDCPPPTWPVCPEVTPVTPMPIEPTPITPTPAAPPPLAPGEAFAGRTTVIGNQLGIPPLAFGRPISPSQNALPSPVLAPSVRTFKMAENESPRPLDRVYYNFNFFDRVNTSVNERLDVDIRDIEVYRNTFGIEKTCLDGNASIGLRVPINTLSSESFSVPGFDRTSTAVGDLSVIFKYILCQSDDGGNLLSAGLAVTAPTGPDQFANSDAVTSFHSTLLQPYVGYILSHNRWFIQGFTAIDIPTDSEDVTVLFNDIALGYYLYQNPDGNHLVSGVVPTVEVHVNTPLNHRGAFDFEDLAGTPDIVTLTFGTHVQLKDHAVLTVGFITPITGPRPFDYEATVQFNWYFGARRDPSVPFVGN